MARRLEGRRVLLTGVSRGVGLETAKRFLGEGARVLGVAKDGPRLGRAARSLAPLGDFAALEVDLVAPDALVATQLSGEVAVNAFDPG